MTSVRSSYTSFRLSYTRCKPQTARDTRDWRGETGKGKFNVQTRMLHCAASISHSAPQHTPSIRCYKSWGITHKRMSHVNSNRNICWIVNTQCWIKEVEYWILKYGCCDCEWHWNKNVGLRCHTDRIHKRMSHVNIYQWIVFEIWMLNSPRSIYTYI